ncbi:hypothetical protein FHL15_004749 [Xylaria flabelliformis]|uniref:Uncharacterized protein n=1 Tax=Xylaria flabelliformis TaxID=2512241 RepID=A0A553I257_9PEZI|nr:hypothetical protein FHL15_004749 [Xylaria flabelliformis]
MRRHRYQAASFSGNSGVGGLDSRTNDISILIRRGTGFYMRPSPRHLLITAPSVPSLPHVLHLNELRIQQMLVDGTLVVLHGPRPFAHRALREANPIRRSEKPGSVQRL